MNQSMSCVVLQQNEWIQFTCNQSTQVAQKFTLLFLIQVFSLMLLFRLIGSEKRCFEPKLRGKLWNNSAVERRQHLIYSVRERDQVKQWRQSLHVTIDSVASMEVSEMLFACHSQKRSEMRFSQRDIWFNIAQEVRHITDVSTHANGE